MVVLYVYFNELLFKNILRMSDTQFDYLLNKLNFKIQKIDMKMKGAISPILN